jgi:aminomethyltransferase
LRDASAILASGETIGETTSGNFSPMLGCGIALGFVRSDSGASLGDQVQIEIRGRSLDATVVPLPFWAKRR